MIIRDTYSAGLIQHMPSSVNPRTASRNPVLPRLLVLLTLFPALAFIDTSAVVSAQSPSPRAAILQLQDLRESSDTSAEAMARLHAIEKRIGDDAPYPVRRELIRTRLAVLEDSTSFEDKLATMKSLRDLAESNGDADTVNLMDIDRIFMNHADDDIDKFIKQLNEVRAHITPDASAEVMEALERSYGNLYFDAGNFDTSLRHQLAALDWAERLPIGRNRARLFRLVTIAELYVAMDLPDQALELVDRGFALNAEKDIPIENRISLLDARAMALLKLGRLPEADMALSAAERISAGDTSDFNKMRVVTLRAGLWLAMSQPRQADETIDRLEALAKQKESAYFLAKSWTLRGEALMRLGKIEEGQALMQRGTDYFREHGQMVDLLVSLDHEIATLRERKLFERAVTTMDERQKLWTQLFRNERGRAIAEVEARHTAESLERRITALSSENRVTEERLRAEKLGKALAAALAALAISLSVFLVLAMRRARRERDSLSRAVRYDALTGALSRYQFQRWIDDDGTKRKPPAKPVGLLLLDLDNFKATNDQFGHDAGDHVLKEIVQRIREVLGEADEVYRWGGEEFLVVLNGNDDAHHERRLDSILSGIKQAAVEWHGHSLSVGVSGGFVQHPLSADWKNPLADAIRWADAALYLAKNSGRGRIEVVRLTDTGRTSLQGRRPIDLAQLLDWHRHGYVVVNTHLNAQNTG